MTGHWWCLVGLVGGSIISRSGNVKAARMFETRLLAEVMAIHPLDPYSADNERLSTREAVDSELNWSEAGLEHDDEVDHVWYMGRAQRTDSTDEHFIWSAQAHQKHGGEPVIVGKTTFSADEVNNFGPRPKELLNVTSVLTVGDDIPGDDDAEGNASSRVAFVEPDILTADPDAWPLSRIIAEALMTVTGYDFDTLMTDGDPKRDADSLLAAGPCKKEDLKTPEQYDQELEPLTELFLQGLGVSTRALAAVANQGWRHCTFNWDAVVVRDRAHYIGYESLPGSMKIQLTDETPLMTADLRFTHHAVPETVKCQNRLAKNLQRFEETVPSRKLSFERSSIPDKLIRYHHNDVIAAINEADLFARAFLAHTITIVRDPLTLEFTRKFQLFRRFNSYALEIMNARDPDNGPVISDLINWYHISQGILRTAKADDVLITSERLEIDPWLRNGYISTAVMEQLTGFAASPVEISRKQVRPLFAFCESYAGDLAWDNFKGYRQVMNDYLDIDYDDWNFISGGHNVITFAKVNQTESADLEDKFRDTCDKEPAVPNATLVVKVPLYNLRYANSCYNVMVRSDVKKHRSCIKDLQGLVVRHYLPPKSLAHLPLSYEEGLEGSNFRQIAERLIQRYGEAPEDLKFGIRRLIADYLEMGAKVWEHLYIHQDATLVNLIAYPQAAADACYGAANACDEVQVRWVDFAYAARTKKTTKKYADTTVMAEDMLSIVKVVQRLPDVDAAEFEMVTEGLKSISGTGFAGIKRVRKFIRDYQAAYPLASAPAEVSDGPA